MKPGPKKTAKLMCRLTEDEKRALEELAISQGYSQPTVWAREMLLSLLTKAV